MTCCSSCTKLPPSAKISALSLHDALPICLRQPGRGGAPRGRPVDRRAAAGAEGAERWAAAAPGAGHRSARSEEHTSELQSRGHLVCRPLLERKNSPRDGPPCKIPTAREWT